MAQHRVVPLLPQPGECGHRGTGWTPGVAPGCCSASPEVGRVTDAVEQADTDQPFQQFGQHGRRRVAQIRMSLLDVSGDVGDRDAGPELVGQPTADMIEGCRSRDVERVLIVGGGHAGDGNPPMVGAGGGTRPSVTC